MANNVIFMDGAELNSGLAWDTFGLSIVAVQSGMSGSYCFDGGAAGYAQQHFSPAEDELWFSFRYRPKDANAINIWSLWDSAGTCILGLYRNITSQLIELRRGVVTAQLILTGTTLMLTGHTYLFQIHVKPLNSGGIVQVKLDNNADFEFDYTGDSTGGLEEISAMRFGRTAGSEVSNCYWDDIIVDNGAWIGNKRIAPVLVPTGVGYQAAQWTPSTGANWQCVDEFPPVDTDYCYTNTPNAFDWFTLSNITGTISFIFAVGLFGRITYEGSPTPPGVKLAIRTNNTNYTGATFGAGSLFGPILSIWMKNPYTTANFTEAEINALEIGYSAQ